MWKIDSNERLLLVLSNVQDQFGHGMSYVDLAGGCNQSELRIEQLVVKQVDDFIYYSKAVTNTACAYLLSRKLIKFFLDSIAETPEARLIGVDWMMNYFMMKASEQNLHIDCFHAMPTVFSHGSVTGEFKAWQR
jgi:hypothetical protein